MLQAYERRKERREKGRGGRERGRKERRIEGGRKEERKERKEAERERVSTYNAFKSKCTIWICTTVYLTHW